MGRGKKIFTCILPWQIGTEHWFLLREDAMRLAAVDDHMSCVRDCFHSDSSPFQYSLQLSPLVHPFRGDPAHYHPDTHGDPGPHGVFDDDEGRGEVHWPG